MAIDEADNRASAEAEKTMTPAPSRVHWVRRAREANKSVLGRYWAYSQDIESQVGSIDFDQRINDVRVWLSTAQEPVRRRDLELISEKLDLIATKKDILAVKDEIIQKLKEDIQELSEQLRDRNMQLAKSRELEACAHEMCDQIRTQSELTRDHMSRELSELRHYFRKFAPHRRFFKVTFGFFFFFLASMFLNAAFGIKIVEPFWGLIGLAITAAMLVIVYFGMKDTEKSSAGPLNKSLE